MSKISARQIENFEAKAFPEPNSGCWLWMGAANQQEGRAFVSINHKSTNAARVSYQIYKGEIPDGGFVLHSCDNALCVNPDHLRVGTQSDNVSDMHRRGRRRGIHRPHVAPNGREKLTDEIVRDIRFGSRSRMTLRAIADELGVSSGTIQFIRSGKTWRHING